jgi:hypothetical protein
MPAVSSSVPNPHHNHLSQKLTVHEYTDEPCGSINAKTGKPEYCDFDCPVLHKQEPAVIRGESGAK